MLWDGVPQSRWTTVTPFRRGWGSVHFPQMLSLSLPACPQVCRQSFQDSHLSLWFPISLQVSVPRDLAVRVGALEPQEAVDCGKNAGDRGSHPCPASWVSIRGSGSHLDSEDRCLSTCHTDRLASQAPRHRPTGSPSFHQALDSKVKSYQDSRVGPCLELNRGSDTAQPQNPRIFNASALRGASAELLHPGLGFSGTKS